MRQPRKWTLGLLPLALLLGLAGFWKQGSVESDLTTRGGASLTGADLDWVKVEVSGRDARLAGEAPSPEARALALAAADRTFGIRRVTDGTTLLPEAKPFVLTALRDGAKITLTGSIPTGAARATLLDAARKAAPNATIVDDLKPARGAAPEFAALAAFGLTELGKLGQGALSLSDTTLSISGRAADFASYGALRARLATLPPGGKLGKGLAHFLEVRTDLWSLMSDQDREAAVMTKLLERDVTADDSGGFRDWQGGTLPW